MSAETEAKADEAPQTRPASAFSRVWRRSFPVFLNWFRTAPCSIILTLIIMLVGISATLATVTGINLLLRRAVQSGRSPL